MRKNPGNCKYMTGKVKAYVADPMPLLVFFTNNTHSYHTKLNI